MFGLKRRLTVEIFAKRNDLFVGYWVKCMKLLDAFDQRLDACKHLSKRPLLTHDAGVPMFIDSED